MSRSALAFALATLLVAAGPAAAQEKPQAPTATAAPKQTPKDLLPGLTIMTLRQTKTLGRTEVADLDIRIEAEGTFDHKRRLMRYVKREGGLERSLVRFEEPPGFRWLAALTIEVKEGDDDQWLYLPEIRKVKRVVRAQTTESFAGTGFSFEDLRSEALDAHTYTTLGLVDLQGRQAYEIEAVPIPGKTRAMKGYAKRRIFVDAERYVEIKVDFYDEEGKFQKTQENSDWKPVSTIFRPYRIFMKEPAKKRTTWIKFRSWTANEPIDDELFTTRELVREDH